MDIIIYIFLLILTGFLLGLYFHFAKFSVFVYRKLIILLKMKENKYLLYLTYLIFFAVLLLSHYELFKLYNPVTIKKGEPEPQFSIILLTCMLTTYFIQFIYGYKYRRKNLKSYFDNVRIFMYSAAAVTALISYIPFNFYGSKLIGISNIYVKLFTTFIILDVLFDLLLLKFLNRKGNKDFEKGKIIFNITIFLLILIPIVVLIISLIPFITLFKN